MKIYVDTSFLVSLYSPDANSPSAARTMQGSSGDHYITLLGELEFVNALHLRVFRKEVSNAQIQLALKEFEKNMQGGIFQLRSLSDQVFERARQLSGRMTSRLETRTADLLHVAAAMELGADRLYTFDRQQRELARVLRLSVN